MPATLDSTVARPAGWSAEEREALVAALTRRKLLGGGLALGLLTACGAAPAGPAATATAPSGFPRTVKHNLGETTIATQPKRVVAFSDGNELATLLALGVKPVAFGQRNDPPLPWIADAGALDPAIQRVPYGTTGPDLERVATWKPDVIIGQATLVQPLYTQLSGIAPTIGTDIADWRLTLRQVAESLGLEERGAAKRAELDGLIAAARERLAPYRDKRATYIALPDTTIFVYNERQTFGLVARELGLPVTPATGAGATNELSVEQARDIQADLLLLGGWNYKGPYGFEALRRVRDAGLLDGVAAVKQNHIVELEQADANALVFANPLTLPRIVAIFEREYVKAFGTR